MSSGSTVVATRLSNLTTLGAEERAVLLSLQGACQAVRAGDDLIHEDQPMPPAYVLVSGWFMSYRLLPDGSRQIIDFQIPGDVLGLSSVFLGSARDSYAPLSSAIVSRIPAARILATAERQPRLFTAFARIALAEEAAIVERLVDIGRRDALQRVARLFLSLGARLRAVGIGTRDSYSCPLTQYQIADALGLCAIHVNRVLRKLREIGCLTFRDGIVVFCDHQLLEEIAGRGSTWRGGTAELPSVPRAPRA